MITASETVKADHAFGLPIGSTARLTASQMAFIMAPVTQDAALPSGAAHVSTNSNKRFHEALERLKEENPGKESFSLHTVVARMGRLS